VQARVDQLAEAEHQLDEVTHLVLGQWQLGELNDASVERRYWAIFVVLVELLQLRRGEVLHGPALHVLGNDEEEDLAQLHLRQGAELQENEDVAVPTDRFVEAR